MTREEASARLQEILSMYVSARDPAEFDLLPRELTTGKLYEAYAVSIVAEQLVMSEGYELTLVNSSYLPLKSSPGPINRSYPHIRLARRGRTVAELWTDINFLSLSYSLRGGGIPSKGDYHELDIAIVDEGLRGMPRHDQVWLGVECKNTGYQKGLLKEILGVRRELSLLSDAMETRFTSWPRAVAPCNPPSCLVVFSTDKKVVEYSQPGSVFGIDFFVEELSL